MKRFTKYWTKKLALTIALSVILASVNTGPIRVSAQTITAEQTTEPTATPTPDPTAEPTIAPAAEPAVTPTPEPTTIPTITPTPEPTTIPTITPTPELTPAPTVTPTPQPTKPPEKFIPDTLKVMSKYDYVGKSLTGISTKKVAVKTLQSNLKAYGKLYGTGMPLSEYKKAMSYLWEDMTEYGKKPCKISLDLTDSMNYSTYVSILKKLSRYDGVYLYKIGKSTEGRDLYAIEIDMKSDLKKNVFMLTGQVHAREFAGGTFIVKEFVDLVQKAQTDKKTMEMLKRNKFVAVPIINVDGREALIRETSKWTRNGELWKAYTNGTEGNRNFPGLQWGEIENGRHLYWIIEGKPTYANYPGKYAGSNSETKALMKWIYHYTVVEKASFFIDLHQQGSIIYAGKRWQTKQQEQKSLDFRTNLLTLINKGSTRRKYTRAYDTSNYGLQGEGSSITDYAASLASGAKFSPAYGFLAFNDGKKEYILLQIKDLDKKLIQVKPANNNLAVATIEIGYSNSALGNSYTARRLMAGEYKNYNFDKLLETLPKLLN